MNKPFLTHEQQLEKLETEKGLLIPDKEYALKTLEEISYYSLISGYKTLFKHKPSGKYNHGVTFEEIVFFYYFDEELRTLFFKHILHVERHIKSLISYYFCKKHGNLQTEYLDINNFNISKTNHKAILKLLHSLQRASSLPSTYSHISHYIQIHNNVPLWVTMNVLTFGNVSAFFQYMESDIQAKVIKHFPVYSEKHFHQFVTILAKCRNKCAHNERLYDFKTTDAIPDTILHEKLQIPRRKGQYALGKQDLFAVVIALRYLINKSDFKRFKSILSKLISSVLKMCPHLIKEQLLYKMGFPANWHKITRYKYN